MSIPMTRPASIKVIAVDASVDLIVAVRPDGSHHLYQLGRVCTDSDIVRAIGAAFFRVASLHPEDES